MKGKGTGAPASAPKATRLRQNYLLSLSLQPLGAARRCVVCGRPVDNGSLGGHDGHSALSGPVRCLRCADFPSQRLFRFGGSQ